MAVAAALNVAAPGRFILGKIIWWPGIKASACTAVIALLLAPGFVYLFVNERVCFYAKNNGVRCW